MKIMKNIMTAGLSLALLASHMPVHAVEEATSSDAQETVVSTESEKENKKNNEQTQIVEEPQLSETKPQNKTNDHASTEQEIQVTEGTLATKVDDETKSTNETSETEKTESSETADTETEQTEQTEKEKEKEKETKAETPVPPIPGYTLPLNKVFKYTSMPRNGGSDGNINPMPGIRKDGEYAGRILDISNGPLQAGGIWSAEPVNLLDGVAVEGYVYLGNKGNQAGDGITFSIMDAEEFNASKTAISGINGLRIIGRNGQGLGIYGGRTNKTVSVEIDTVINADATDYGIPLSYGSSHVAVTVGGQQVNTYEDTKFKNQPLAHEALSEVEDGLSNGLWKKIKISIDTKNVSRALKNRSMIIKYSLADINPDGSINSGSAISGETKPITYNEGQNFDFRSYNADDNGSYFAGAPKDSVYWGFTGATGEKFTQNSIGLTRLPESPEVTQTIEVKNISENNQLVTKDQPAKVGDELEVSVSNHYVKGETEIKEDWQNITTTLDYSAFGEALVVKETKKNEKQAQEIILGSGEALKLGESKTYKRKFVANKKIDNPQKLITHARGDNGSAEADVDFKINSAPIEVMPHEQVTKVLGEKIVAKDFIKEVKVNGESTADFKVELLEEPNIIEEINGESRTVYVKNKQAIKLKVTAKDKTLETESKLTVNYGNTIGVMTNGADRPAGVVSLSEKQGEPEIIATYGMENVMSDVDQWINSANTSAEQSITSLYGKDSQNIVSLNFIRDDLGEKPVLPTNKFAEIALGGDGIRGYRDKINAALKKSDIAYGDVIASANRPKDSNQASWYTTSKDNTIYKQPVDWMLTGKDWSRDKTDLYEVTKAGFNHLTLNHFKNPGTVHFVQSNADFNQENLLNWLGEHRDGDIDKTKLTALVTEDQLNKIDWKKSGEQAIVVTVFENLATGGQAKYEYDVKVKVPAPITVKHVYDDGQLTPIPSIENQVIYPDGKISDAVVSVTDLNDKGYQFKTATVHAKPISATDGKYHVAFSDKEQVVYLKYDGQLVLEKVPTKMDFGRHTLGTINGDLSPTIDQDLVVKDTRAPLSKDWSLTLSNPVPLVVGEGLSQSLYYKNTVLEKNTKIIVDKPTDSNTITKNQLETDFKIKELENKAIRPGAYTGTLHWNLGEVPTNDVH